MTTKTAPKAELRQVSLPEIGRPTEPRPEVPASVFESRLRRVRQAMDRLGLEAMLIYGDREHLGNLHYLTNYDPRFEESILIVFPQGKPQLLVGNEGLGYSKIARLDVERWLCQTLSLLGQPRDRVVPLRQLLRDAGLTTQSRVGIAGWKYFTDREVDDAIHALDCPDFIARSIRAALPQTAEITNQTALFMDPHTGLRNCHEIEQLADFEWIATHNSQSLLEGILALKPGLTEFEVFARMTDIGLPFGCHSLISSGPNARQFGMASPTSRCIELGDPLMATYSYQGANCCRVGFVARGSEDLPQDAKDYVFRCAGPYFEAVSAWYQALRVGVTGDDLHHAVRDRLDPAGFAVALNAGHQIAVDEWTHSPIAAGEKTPLHSGAYLQCDFFGTLPGPCFASFTEDGLFLADSALRQEMAMRYPELWKRVQHRRRFMTESLGVALHEDVLPVSNFPGMTLPYLLSPDRCLCMCR